MPIERGGHAHKRNQDIGRAVRAMIPKEEVVSIGGQAEGYIDVVSLLYSIYIYVTISCAVAYRAAPHSSREGSPIRKDRRLP